ncbi:hypothetical protein PoB_002048700 [Plakobranchus ocellatus]|uniref:Uncharacterized protein n=1 Tax=Plakobranchus ocellatus TaxID=259542 RepID=A0AAV3ZHG5_9GAST|nr:hypothetical protein PoB_002048700 [Plakobranchus ocellatus]
MPGESQLINCISAMNWKDNASKILKSPESPGEHHLEDSGLNSKTPPPLLRAPLPFFPLVLAGSALRSRSIIHHEA